MLEKEFLEERDDDVEFIDDIDDIDDINLLGAMYSIFPKELNKYYINLLSEVEENEHSPFLITSKSMRAVNKYNIKTSLGNDIRLGDQLVGDIIIVPGFFSIPGEIFYLLFKEEEIQEFSELADNVFSDFVQLVSQNEACIWYAFNESYKFMSLKSKFYIFLKDANNINVSHDISELF